MGSMWNNSFYNNGPGSGVCASNAVSSKRPSTKNRNVSATWRRTPIKEGREIAFDRVVFHS